jgi:hypothetical protein
MSRASSNWHSLLIEQHHFPSIEVELDGLIHTRHVIVMNVGRSLTCEVRGDQIRWVTKERGATSFYPSHQPFFRRAGKDENGSLDVLYVALDPLSLAGQRRISRSIPIASNSPSESVMMIPPSGTLRWPYIPEHRLGRADDQMYGEALSTALAVHLLREYGGMSMGQQQPRDGLSGEKTDALPGIHS